MAKSIAKKAPQKPAAKPAPKAPQSAAKGKATPAKTATKPATAKPSAVKKSSGADASAKSAAAKGKPSTTKATTPPAAKGAAKASPKSTATKGAVKPAAKPEVKAAKPEAQKKAAAPGAKETPKGAAKPVAGKKSSSGKVAKVDPKAAARAALPRKKLNVGQKPRSDKSNDAPRPIFTSAPLRDEDSASPAVKATPASKEAKQTFKVNDHVVYPAHGVGRIVGIEKQHIAGITNELFVIDFEQEKMKLRVPTAKAMMVGMRALADDALVKKAVDLLKGRARIKRTMWSRRAQEYEAKINSGDILAVAEVVRDLFRATDQPEQSYSERQLFEAALDRLAREVAAVRKTDLAAAITELEGSLQQKKAA